MLDNARCDLDLLHEAVGALQADAVNERMQRAETAGKPARREGLSQAAEPLRSSGQTSLPKAQQESLAGYRQQAELVAKQLLDEHQEATMNQQPENEVAEIK